VEPGGRRSVSPPMLLGLERQQGLKVVGEVVEAAELRDDD
jgi:hypothetical protein